MAGMRILTVSVASAMATYLYDNNCNQLPLIIFWLGCIFYCGIVFSVWHFVCGFRGFDYSCLAKKHKHGGDWHTHRFSCFSYGHVFFRQQLLSVSVDYFFVRLYFFFFFFFFFIYKIC